MEHFPCCATKLGSGESVSFVIPSCYLGCAYFAVALPSFGAIACPVSTAPLDTPLLPSLFRTACDLDESPSAEEPWPPNRRKVKTSMPKRASNTKRLRAAEGAMAGNSCTGSIYSSVGYKWKVKASTACIL